MAVLCLRPEGEQSVRELLGLGALWRTQVMYALVHFHTYVGEDAFKLICHNLPDCMT